MSRLTACPEPRNLELALAGRLSGEEALAIERHVRACLRCTNSLRSLTAAAPTPCPESVSTAEQAVASDPVRDGVIARLRELVREAAPGADNDRESVSQETYDFLAPPEAVGEIGRLGKYRILRVIGSGGMGIVFEAQHPKMARHVALKAMKPALAASAGYRRRFEREARAASSLAHDHIVTIHDVDEDRSIPFLAMELLEGESLAMRLRREGRLSPGETARIGRQIALGLAAAHERGLVHRDIKPDNIWLAATRGGNPASPTAGEATRVKILDFGIACIDDGNAALTGTNRIVGTVGYLSPEQARCDRVDARSDLFSLGCVLYRCCTGENAFGGRTDSERIVAVTTQEPAAPNLVRSDVPAPLSDLIMRLVAKQPEQRPQSATDVARELKGSQRGRLSVSSPGHASAKAVGQEVPDIGKRSRQAATLLEHEAKPRSTGKVFRLMIVAFVIVAIGSGIYWRWTRSRNREKSPDFEVVADGDNRAGLFDRQRRERKDERAAPLLSAMDVEQEISKMAGIVRRFLEVNLENEIVVASFRGGWSPFEPLLMEDLRRTVRFVKAGASFGLHGKCSSSLEDGNGQHTMTLQLEIVDRHGAVVKEFTRRFAVSNETFDTLVRQAAAIKKQASEDVQTAELDAPHERIDAQIAEIAESVRLALQERGESKIVLGNLTGPPGSVTPLFARILYEELEQRLSTTRVGGCGISGNYSGRAEESGRRFLIELNLEVRNRHGELMTRFHWFVDTDAEYGPTWIGLDEGRDQLPPGL